MAAIVNGIVDCVADFARPGAAKEDGRPLLGDPQGYDLSFRRDPDDVALGRHLRFTTHDDAAGTEAVIAASIFRVFGDRVIAVDVTLEIVADAVVVQFAVPDVAGVRMADQHPFTLALPGRRQLPGSLHLDQLQAPLRVLLDAV